MNFSELAEQAAAISGDGLSLTERATRLGKAITTQAETSYAKLSALTGLFSCWVANVPTIDQDSVQELHEALQSATDHGLTIVSNSCKSIVISAIVSEEHIETVSCNGIQQFTAQLSTDESQVVSIITSTVSKPLQWADGTDLSLDAQTLVTNLTTGVQMTQVYSDICKVVSDNVEAGPECLTTTVASVLSGKLSEAMDIKTNLLSSASMGPEGLLQCITTVFKTTNDYFTGQSSGTDPELNDTDFEVSAFSWGIVGGTLVSLAQVAAAVLTALGGVLTVIGALAGAALNLVKNVVSNVIQAEADTAFLNSNPFGAAAFNIVLDEYTIDNQNLTDAMNALQANSFTVTSQYYPCMIIGIRQADGHSFKCQEIPSVNFRLSKTIFWDSSTGGYANYNRLFIFKNAIYRHDQSYTTPSILLSTGMTASTVSALVYSAYDPVSVTISNYLDQIKDFTQSDIRKVNANVYCERLVSSMILWWITKNYVLLTSIKQALNNSNIRYIFFPVMEDVAFTWDDKDCLESKMMIMIAKLGYVYASGIGVGNGSAASNVEFSDVQDSLLTNVLKPFINKVAWRTTTGVEYSDYLYYGYATDTNATLQYAAQIQNGGATTLANIYAPADYHSACLGGYNMGDTYVLGSNGKNITSGLSKRCAISVPRALISGVFLGILADVALIAVMAVAAAATVRLSLKIRNKMKRAEVDLEAKKYEYENSLSNGSTPERQEELWKEYKTARTKFNIRAMLTGGAKSSDLYSTGKDPIDVMSPITDRITGTSLPSSSTDPSILQLVRIIAGTN